MKLSTKLGIIIIGTSILTQIIAESFYSPINMWRVLVQSMIISWIATACVWYGFRKLETETEKAKTGVMKELGLTKEDIEIYRTKFIPLIRKLKDLDLDKTVRIIEYGIKKVDKINIDELEGSDWGLDDIEDEPDFTIAEEDY